MQEVARRDYPFTREVVDRAEANRRFADDPLKLERIAELGDDETISVYTDGPFVDLCRGPHVPSTGRLKHFKLLHAAGAYWRGDEKRQMLQRIYGTAWFARRISTRICTGWRRRAAATIACSAASSICIRSRTSSAPGSCSGIPRGRSSSGC